MSHRGSELPRRRLGAVLFADVAGYSRLMRANELITHDAVMARMRRFKSLAPVHDGEVLNTTGDGLLIYFQGVTAAVQFAVEIQKEIERENQSVEPSQRINFRIAINFGDMILEDGNVYGEAVNIAARLQSHAKPGGVCVTRAVYDELRNRLSLGFEYLGTRLLKNIGDEIEVYRLHDGPIGGLLTSTRRPRRGETLFENELPSSPSVAVLPFKLLDSHPRQDFLADGITDDITTNLSRFRGLFVIARGSAFIYKEQALPIHQISTELGVQYLVQGSVRRSANRIRISVFLVDALESETVWSEIYDRQDGSLFEVQDEITRAAVAAMAVQIEAAEARRLRQYMPTDLQAYGLVLQGQQRLYRYRREDNVTARQLYEAAIDCDPCYARAFAAISRTHYLDWRYAWSKKPEDSLDRAMTMAKDAIRLDPGDSRGYGELGNVQLYRKEHDLSIASYGRALELNPNDADIMADMADALTHAGRTGEAVELFNAAIRLNPFYPDHYLWGLAGAYYDLKDYRQAIRLVSRMNNPAEGQRLLAASHAQLGHTAQASRHAERVLKAHPNFSLARWQQVLPDRHVDKTEHFLEGLRKAGL